MRESLAPMLTSLLALALQAAAPAPLPSDPVESDWRDIPADELLVMTLAADRQVVIRLAPRYAPVHVANIRTLAAAGWWDVARVYRVHDNYVVQWGDPTEKKPLPKKVVAQPPAEYDWANFDAVTRLTRTDPYSKATGHSADGWPLATNGKVAWIPHCYAMVGVARDLAPSTGSGGDLYAVIGHGPRHLDRNIAIVGRVVEGIEHLSALPRGTEGGLGLYKEARQHVPFVRGRLASDLPESERPRFQYRAADNVRFAAWIKARENRQPPFFNLPLGGADICNVMPPVRRAP